MLITAVLALMTVFFGVSSHASIRQCDFSNPKDRDIDGSDLAQFTAHYAAGTSEANVDGVGGVAPQDVVHFAKFFGTSRLPNILLIIADDVGLDVTTGMYPGLLDNIYNLYINHSPPHPGASNIVRNPASTPQLDRLAREGRVFANTWAQPFCSPTRATIITGMFAAKTNVAAYDEPMSTSHITFVQRLKDEANYSTAIFGKWHLAGPKNNYTGVLPKQAGFELFKGHLDSAISPTYWSYNYLVQDEETDSTTYRTESAPTKTLPAGTTPAIAATTFEPVVRAADTIEWINEREAEDPSKPWFAWLAFNEAHVLVPPDSPYYHVPNADTLDQASYDEVAGPNGCGGVPGTNTSGLCTDKQLMRAMTNAMDTVIGKVLEAVDSIPSDTYVIFIGDNGSWSNNIDNMYITITGRGKTTAYESGARVPMAIKGPGITAGSRSDEFIHAADLFSTCLQIAGLEVAPEGLVYKDYQGNPANLDGVSLASILFDSTTAVRDPHTGYILTEVGYNGIKVGARNSTYKVIRRQYFPNQNLFYNLIDDPLEEYPLTPPGSCENYTNGTWKPGTDPEWHYCRLIEVINLYSIFP
jgi:arylsulfatase A-like enzyme